MDPRLEELLQARRILESAYLTTIGIGPAHEKVWRAIEYLDKQIDPIIHAMLEVNEVTA